MIDTCKLHDDLEHFASYLGIDYEDYYEMIYNLNDKDEDVYDYDYETVNVNFVD